MEKLIKLDKEGSELVNFLKGKLQQSNPKTRMTDSMAVKIAIRHYLRIKSKEGLRDGSNPQPNKQHN